ncbi:MAG: cytochrome C552 [Bacteroidetes bacterium]|nr:cytochrome C552 [Bacteroidota bacterium]
MKKIMFFASLSAILVSATFCSTKKEVKSEDYGDPKEEATAQPGDVVAIGESLVKSSDCNTCHHKINKIIGPPHLDVAKKYEFTVANVNYLAEKIAKGGSGVWGQISMTPHPDIAKPDAEKMARYILSLDGEKEH